MVYMGKLQILGVMHSDKPQPIEKSQEQKLEIKRQWEFQQYVLWCNIPSFLKMPPTDKKGNKPTPEDFCRSMGIEDENIIELAKLRSSAEFSKRFGIHENTLIQWRRKIGERDLLTDIRAFAEPLTKNVVMSLYNQTLRGGLPQHYELFFNFVNSWSKKINIDVRKRVIKTIKVEIVDPQHAS